MSTDWISDTLQELLKLHTEVFTDKIMLILTLEKEIATHSSILAWEIPWTNEPGRLQSTGSQSLTQLND